MKDTYDNWVDRVVGGRQGKPLSAGEVVATSADEPEPFNTIEFSRVEREHYVAEVGKKGGDYVYHFFPKLEDKIKFEEKMGEAFIGAFKSADQIEAGFTEELNSWAVRARGLAHSMWGDELAMKVFDTLDSLLES